MLERLRELQEMCQSLTQATGFKALMKRFGDTLAGPFGAGAVSYARIQGKGSRLTLKRRAIKVPGVATHDDATLERLAAVLGETETRATEFRDGFLYVAVGGKDLALTVVDDPLSKGGCLVAWDPQAPTVGRDDALQQATLDFVVRQVQSESRWYRRLDKTQSLAHRDDLTGLYNARYLDVVLEAELRRASRMPTSFCLLFIDLDGFKPINDVHGHLSGSSVLKQVGEVIREAVREIDVPLRYGGDEFVVVLLGATSSKGQLAAERVRRRIEQKEFRAEGGAIVRLTASIGLAAYPEHGKDRETLLKIADETMYNSKRSGKNRVTVVPARTSES